MTRRILIIGGNGLVGKRIVEILKTEKINLAIFIGSRSQTADIEHNTIKIDVNNRESLSSIYNFGISLVVLCAEDEENNVLQFCIDNAIDFLDISKPTPRLKSAYKLSINSEIKSKIVFASGWMGASYGNLFISYQK